MTRAFAIGGEVAFSLGVILVLVGIHREGMANVRRMKRR